MAKNTPSLLTTCVANPNKFVKWLIGAMCIISGNAQQEEKPQITII
jgi:hypothetical protein